MLATVRALCGVQAQVQSAAELQLWARLDDLSPNDVRRALWDDRSLVKTWSMRGTLHLLAADDLPLFVAALRTHDRWWKGAWLRMVDCDADELRRVLDGIAETLTDVPRRRDQLAEAVAGRVGARLKARLLSGWAELLKPAAFAGALICGPPDGQNVTFVRPDRWLAGWREPRPDDAWRLIVRRYLHAYGPASREELARWWGMQPAPAGRVLKASSSDLAEVSVEGRAAWAVREDLAALKLPPARRAPLRLLPAFDVYVIGTRPRSAIVDHHFEDRVFRRAGWISAVVLVDGQAAGVWTHEVERGKLQVDVELFRPLGKAERVEIQCEVDRLGQFLDAAPRLVYREAARGS